MVHIWYIQVTQALLGQCRKRTLGYKAVAIATTGEVVDTLGVDIFAEFSNILFPLLTTVSEEPGSSLCGGCVKPSLISSFRTTALEGRRRRKRWRREGQVQRRDMRSRPKPIWHLDKRGLTWPPRKVGDGAHSQTREQGY